MKKTKLLAIPVLAALAFAGCASAPTATNKAPSVVGVKDIQCMVNSTVDFLDGVAALDNEDGDITPKLDITVTPQVEVNDGYAYFTEVGEYTVNYKVSDREGRTAQKKAYVDVVDRETYKTFATPEGFSAQADGSATIEKCGLVNGAFILEAKGGEIAEDVKLTRTYTINTKYSSSLQYTFRYTVNSDKAGKIKILADGYTCAEAYVNEGDNVISFNHTLSKLNGKDDIDVTIDVCPGGLGNIHWTVEKVEIEYSQKAGELADRTENFNFAGKVITRIDNDNGNLNITGNSWSNSVTNTAHLEINSASENQGDVWRGGMFIYTGVKLRSGVTYKVSFNVEKNEDKYCEITIQRGQWNEAKFKTLYNPGDGKIEEEITVEDAAHVGTLWLYVQSGSAVNEITLSDLSVIEQLEPIGTDEYTIENFSQDGGALSTDTGKLTFTVENFASTDSGNRIVSPSFFTEGSGGNYVMTFRAKATQPVKFLVTTPTAYGNYDEALFFKNDEMITREEKVFTIIGNGKAVEAMREAIFMFGFTENQQYNGAEQNVTIEISDIKISLKNSELDG